MMTRMFGFFACANAGVEPTNPKTATNDVNANDILQMRFMYVLHFCFFPAKRDPVGLLVE
jgi:hypothetical protein